MAIAATLRAEDRASELGELRRQIIARTVPVLMDAADVAVALDISEHAVWERFDNMVMAGDRCLVRAEEVRAAVLAMRPKPAPKIVVALCLSCGDALPPGTRRFCSPRCARLTPSGRARLLAERAQRRAAEMAVIPQPPFAGMADTTRQSLEPTLGSQLLSCNAVQRP